MFAQGSSAASLLAPVKAQLEALEAFFQAEVSRFEPAIREAASYSLSNPGKRIRPVLCFYTAWPLKDAQQEDIIRAAAIVELVHQATLIHDDILDRAQLRHQSPTLARRYGESVAVLLGDALFAHALRLASDFPTVEVCRLVSETTRKLCAGEIAQTLQHRHRQLGLEDYFAIIEAKTAELFAASCQLGASLSGHSEEQVEGAARFGRHLGRAYQVFDDMADLFADEQKAGKTLGTDLAYGKLTLPTLRLIEVLGKEGETLAEELLEGGIAQAELLSQMQAHGIAQRVCEDFETELSQAESAIASWEGSEAYPHLASILAFVRAQMDRLDLAESSTQEAKASL